MAFLSLWLGPSKRLEAMKHMLDEKQSCYDINQQFHSSLLGYMPSKHANGYYTLGIAIFHQICGFFLTFLLPSEM